MKVKFLGTCQIFAGVTALTLASGIVGMANPAYALSIHSEIQSGDPSRNDTFGSADFAGDLPATGDAVYINGKLFGNGNASGDVDWFSFVIGEAGTLSTSFTSSHSPASALQSILYLATDPATPLQTLNFTSPGGTGGLVTGTYAANTKFLVKILGNASANPNYAYLAELQPLPPGVPTPALLPGLIGMGAAAWRKRRGELGVSSEGQA